MEDHKQKQEASKEKKARQKYQAKDKNKERQDTNPFARKKNQPNRHSIGGVDPSSSFSSNKMAKQAGDSNTTNTKGNLPGFFERVNQRKMSQQGSLSLKGRTENGQADPLEEKQPSQMIGDALGSFVKNKAFGAFNKFGKKSVLDDDENGAGEDKTVQNLGKKIAGIAGKAAGFLSAPSGIIALGLISIIVGIFGVSIVTSTTTSITVGNYAIDFLISERWGEEITGIEVNESMYEEDQISFVDRIISLAETYRNNGKSFDPHLISATQAIIQQYNKDFTYNAMTSDVMQELVDLMFVDDFYNEDAFRENLMNSFLPNYADNVDANLYEKIVDEIFQYIEDYKSLVSLKKEEATSSGNICTYIAPGVNINGSQRQVSINATDIQVQLMQSAGSAYGGISGQKMEGEELVPFETYAGGCAYQEMGPDKSDDALRSQIIAARSYALVRPFDMGGWHKLAQENGIWKLYISSSTADQVYCSLEKGCSSTRGNCQNGMIYSGTDRTTVCKYPLSSDHKLYTLRDEMAGKVLVDKDGYIIYTGYLSDDQNRWEREANQGYDYTQILLSTYGNRGAAEVKQMACTSGSSASGDYASWKQYDERWGSIPLSPGQETMSQIGCLVTSLAILVAKSGVPTPMIDGTFDPGTFVQALSKIGTFDFSGNLTDFSKVTTIAPTFQYIRDEALSGAQSNKTAMIKTLLDQGYYLVAFVTNSQTASHFIAIDSVEGDRVKIMDPGSESTDLWSTYDSSRLILFKKGS